MTFASKKHSFSLRIQHLFFCLMSFFSPNPPSFKKQIMKIFVEVLVWTEIFRYQFGLRYTFQQRKY